MASWLKVEMRSKPFRCMPKAVLLILADIAGQLTRELNEAIANCLLRTAEKSLQQGKWSHVLEEQHIEERWVKIVQEELRKERRGVEEHSFPHQTMC